MLDPKIFRNFLITRRQFVLGGIQASLVALLVGRLGYLQLYKYNQYLQRSKKNRTSKILLTPIRGEIIDCKDIKVATNLQQFNLILRRPTSKIAQNSLEKVFNLLQLSVYQQQEIKQKIKNTANALLMQNLSWEQVVLIEQNIFDLKHVFIEYNLIRGYPFANCMSHLIGYATLEYDEFGRVCPIGKSGIEKTYNQELKGEFGIRELEVDAHGNTVRELNLSPSQTGQNMTLSIDCSLQNKIATIFQNLTGAAIVYDLKKQQILSMFSSPNFESNDFASKNLSHKKWQNLQQDPKLPLLNKAISSVFPPGSIFKLVTCLAALKYGISPNEKFLCKAGGFLGDKFNCWKLDGHGLLNMEEAIGVSCNHYMYHVAQIVGQKNITDMARSLGLGQKVGIDLPGEVQGSLPGLTIFKPSLSKALNLCIGQGEIAATPLQLSRLISIIACKGRLASYHLKLDGPSSSQKLGLDPRYFEVIHKGMWRSVNHISGTSKAVKSKIILAGKTGTAQVFSKKNVLDPENIPWHLRNHALFGGFGPFEDPRFSVMVVIEHGGSGGRDAAPVAKKIFDLLW
ncbi:hypothetical protein phytr_8610 [Candidatus Phycorickettsia trachydisci]|uniref:Penicillin-binding protein 2 n=1 Tax=Candidatus Phycorickettsia trachydisci TaxID=2115978 RepID=A0A2P1P959_9RICK|nr:penicillin-binding protein 2 [Candidatus Phycorickettsia trachydisci]AVP87793.1 hypothetical protein phytr_8610 [Candidatus Phycorickettsia trachydisci]